MKGEADEKGKERSIANVWNQQVQINKIRQKIIFWDQLNLKTLITKHTRFHLIHLGRWLIMPTTTVEADHY